MKTEQELKTETNEKKLEKPEDKNLEKVEMTKEELAKKIFALFSKKSV